MIKNFVFNHFAENTYLVFNEKKDCVIIDPGNKVEAETLELENFVKNNDLKVQAILLTHPHLDHFCGIKELAEDYNVPVYNLKILIYYYILN